MALPLLFLVALTFLAPAQPETVPARVPLDHLLSARDLRKYRTEDDYHSKLEMLRKAIERRSDHLPDQIEERDLAVIFRTLAEIRGLVSEALSISVKVTDKDERRHKEVKKLEIELRRLSAGLGDMSLAVPLEDRNQFDITQKLIEELRNQLLRQLFGKAIGEASTPTTARPPTVSSSLLPVAREEAYRSTQGLWDLDKFTEEEFRRIQLSQKLVKRIEVFLDIAEQRLNEIDRRRNQIEWDKEEPNPLEFYMYGEMLHAYVRAVEGIMKNIDLKARDGTEEVKDVRKALEKLEEKSMEFKSRLDAIEPFIREQRDQELLEVYGKAVETTNVAAKGARYGLEKLKDKDD